MSQATLPIISNPVARPAEAPTAGQDRSRMRQSRIIGALFLAGFLFYGVGSSVVASLVASPGFLGTIAPVASLLALGAFLMLLNSAVDIAKAVLLFPILERHSQRSALTYFATMIVEVVLLSIGVLAVLMIVPLSQHAGEPGSRTLGELLVEANGMAYQVGQMTLGVGATVLCVILFRTRLVPRWLAVAGLIGYPLHALGTVAEVFGVHVGLYFTMPGFFFELALPIWLLVKGFQRSAFEGPASPVSRA
jgi:hypothetical protein